MFYFLIWTKNKIILRIGSGWKLNIVSISLRLAWKILILTPTKRKVYEEFAKKNGVFQNHSQQFKRRFVFINLKRTRGKPLYSLLLKHFKKVSLRFVQKKYDTLKKLFRLKWKSLIRELFWSVKLFALKFDSCFLSNFSPKSKV